MVCYMPENRSSAPKQKTADTAVFSVRLPTSDIDALSRAARESGVSRNRFIGILARRGSGVLDPDPKMLDAWRETLRQLVGVATNLNQLARSANRGGVIWKEEDREDVIATAKIVSKLRNDLGAIANAARLNREATVVIARLLKEREEKGIDDA